MTADPEIDKLTATVADYPDVVELRLRLIRLLADRGRHADALARAAEGLRIAPDNAEIRAEVSRLAGALGAPAAGTPPAEPPQAVETPSEDGGFDWDRAESEVTDIVGPQYVGDQTEEPARPAPRTATRMSDVAGMDAAKAAIEMSFIGPLRNPELARAFGTGAGAERSRPVEEGLDEHMRRRLTGADCLCGMVRRARKQPFAASQLLAERLLGGDDTAVVAQLVPLGQHLAAAMGETGGPVHERIVNVALAVALSDRSTSPAEVAEAGLVVHDRMSG